MHLATRLEDTFRKHQSLLSLHNPQSVKIQRHSVERHQQRQLIVITPSTFKTTFESYKLFECTTDIPFDTLP